MKLCFIKNNQKNIIRNKTLSNIYKTNYKYINNTSKYNNNLSINTESKLELLNILNNVNIKHKLQNNANKSSKNLSKFNDLDFLFPNCLELNIMNNEAEKKRKRFYEIKILNDNNIINNNSHLKYTPWKKISNQPTSPWIYKYLRYGLFLILFFYLTNVYSIDNLKLKHYLK